MMHYACIPFLYIFCLPFYPFPKLRFTSTLHYKHTKSVSLFLILLEGAQHRVKLFKQASKMVRLPQRAD